MGENEIKPSGKRYRRGTAIKYRHPAFHSSSTPEELASIKRRTCSSNEKQTLTMALKQARTREAQMALEVLRLNQRITAIQNDIMSRKKASSDSLTHGDLFSGPALRALTPTPPDEEDIAEGAAPKEKEGREAKGEQRAPKESVVDNAGASSYNDQLCDIILSAGLDDAEISDALSLSL